MSREKNSECQHNWLVVAGYYISSSTAGKAHTTHGYKLCDKCGESTPWPPIEEKDKP